MIYDNGWVKLYQADARSIPLNYESVDCCITSPPYWGLRDYGVDGQLGLEPTPDLYVQHMVEVFREVWRVLKPQGTLWLNLGDSFNEKQLVGIPWRVAFALQADGWWLRSDIIWSKLNPMPESVTDRPTKAHEYLFLLTKSERYYYDAEAIREPAEWARWGEQTIGKNYRGIVAVDMNSLDERRTAGRNKRSVWEIATQPYAEAHFATFPEALVEPCVLAGSSERGVCPECGAPWVRIVERTAMELRRTNNHPPELRTRTSGTMTKPPSLKTTGWEPTCHHDAEPVAAVVLDPFIGSGTTAAVAQRLGRRAVGLDLNAEYLEMATKRVGAVPLPMRLQ